VELGRWGCVAGNAIVALLLLVFAFLMMNAREGVISFLLHKRKMSVCRSVSPCQELDGVAALGGAGATIALRATVFFSHGIFGLRFYIV